MKCLGRALFAAVLGLLSIGLVSCGDYVGKEKSHPLFVKGGTCKSSGNYKDAAKYFEEFQTICPKSALTHYELASLYGDHLEDPVKAIYHYQKYLELAPPDSSDVASVKQFVDLAEKKVYDKLGEKYKITPESERLARELAETKDKLAKYVDYATKLKAQNELMRQRLIGGKGAAKSADAAKPAGAAGEAKPADAKKASSYKVKAGDTLAKISKEVYGTSSHQDLIKSANKAQIPASGNLKPGTELKIPALPAASAKAPAAKAPAKAPAAKPAEKAPVEADPFSGATLD